MHKGGASRVLLVAWRAATAWLVALPPSAPSTNKRTAISYAAYQAGRSHRYGGIHVEAGDLDGRWLGRRVGANAWTRAAGYFAGTASPQER